MDPRRLLVASWLVICIGCEGGDDPPTTTAAGTSTATGGADDGGATASTSPATSGADGSGGADATGAAGLMCTSVDECRLLNNCCTCEAIHRDAEIPECAAQCDRPLCDVWGISELLCSHDCHLLLVECDQAMIECADPPPNCEAGFVPSLDDRCWSGHCVPEQLCRP